jgi:hypothetical protein
MKQIIIAFCSAVLLFSCNDAEDKMGVENNATKETTTSSDTKATDETWIPVDSATAMQTMMEVGTPGKEHDMLAKSDGNWTGETTMWMTPDGQPMKSTLAATNKMIMNNRYQETKIKGDMMGMPYEGVSVTGYDKAKKMFTSTWMDNMSTATIYMEGPWDEATKSITFTGKMLCPANGKMCEIKQVYKMIDNNTQLMEMYGPDMKTGKEYKNMEMKLTRKG